MIHERQSNTKPRRLGVVVVQVVVMLAVMVGFAALTVDVGAMYNARGELQRTADAASLAAAAALSEFASGDPAEVARARASEFTARNTVFGRTMQLDPNADVIMGRARYDASTGSYTFTPTELLPDAVRIRVRLTADSPNGAFPLFFAALLGKANTELSAEAVAMMVPRDIAIVADLSGSHNDDSELRNYRTTGINLFDVWAALPISKGNNGVGNGIDPAPPGNPNSPNDPAGTEPGHPGNQGGRHGPSLDLMGGSGIGPTWGRMYNWGDTIDEDYDPVRDPGLMYLPRYRRWDSPSLVAWYRAVGYSESEINALVSGDYDGSRDSGGQYAWTNRVAVALGLARWDSGQRGGLWESLPPDRRNEGNGNNWVGSGELTWLVDYPFDSGSWSDYIYRYVGKSYTMMARANGHFRYRFGLKTFVNYLLERQPSSNETPELAHTPAQPMQAVKDAVQHMAELLANLNTNDQISLEIYGTTAHHEVDLTNDFLTVSKRLNDMQAAHYDGWTNMGGGIERAVEELTGPRARSSSRKVIFLLTDGNANVSASGRVGDYEGGAAYSRAAAERAVAVGAQIFAVSVGTDADQSLMQEIAEMGGGEHFHAEGSIADYSAQLDAIFQILGGKRAVQLIQ